MKMTSLFMLNTHIMPIFSKQARIGFLPVKRGHETRSSNEKLQYLLEQVLQIFLAESYF